MTGRCLPGALLWADVHCAFGACPWPRGDRIPAPECNPGYQTRMRMRSEGTLNGQAHPQGEKEMEARGATTEWLPVERALFEDQSNCQ